MASAQQECDVNYVNWTAVLQTAVWPVCIWLSVRSVCWAVRRSGEQELEKIRLMHVFTDEK